MSRREGFSLLEAVVALSLVGSVSIATLAAFSAQLRTSQRALVGLEAQALAEDRLARVRLVGQDEIAHLPDSLRGGRFAMPWDRFTWKTTTRELIDRPSLFEAKTEVSWDGGSYELATRLYRPARLVTAR
jgi:type II secretory pathway pseudopilin PulG